MDDLTAALVFLPLLTSVLMFLGGLMWSDDKHQEAWIVFIISTLPIIASALMWDSMGNSSAFSRIWISGTVGAFAGAILLIGISELLFVHSKAKNTKADDLSADVAKVEGNIVINNHGVLNQKFIQSAPWLLDDGKKSTLAASLNQIGKMPFVTNQVAKGGESRAMSLQLVEVFARAGWQPRFPTPLQNTYNVSGLVLSGRTAIRYPDLYVKLKAAFKNVGLELSTDDAANSFAPYDDDVEIFVGSKN